MKPKILLTGSCSFLLSNFIRKCTYEKADYSFVSIDRTNEQTIHSLYFNKNHTFYVADILDPHILNVIFKTESPDIVIHGAALTSPEKSITNSSQFLQTNVVGTENVIRASVDHKVSKFIYLSTSQVYGETEGACELTPANPLTPYALSKYMGEQLLLQAHKRNKLNYLITRVTEVYGQRQTSDKFIPKAIGQILSKTSVDISNPEVMKDWLYVGDHSLALLALLKENVSNEIFNVGSKQEFSKLEMIQHLCNAMEDGHQSIQCSSDKVDRINLINSNKIQYLWKNQTKVKSGMLATAEWYKNNSWWFQSNVD